MLGKIFYFFFFSTIIFHNKVYIFSYITLPLDTLKKENILTPYLPNTIEDKIYEEYCSPFFTEIEIGTPPQKIPLLIELKTNDFVITSVNKMQAQPDNYYSNKSCYDFNEILSGRNFFNENKSNSFKNNYCMKRERYYRYEDYEYSVAEENCPSHDDIYLYEDLNLKNKIKLRSGYFDLVRNIKDNITGVIGLHLYNNQRTAKSFLNLLKNNNLTTNYFFFFDFDSPQNKKGKLILGSYIDEIYPNNYKREELYFAKSNKGYYYYNILFNKISVEYNETKILYKKENSDTELDFERDIIIAGADFKNLLFESLKDLIDDNKCFLSNFMGCSDFYDGVNRNISFFYCINKEDIAKELKDRILPIKFFTYEYNYTFEILPEDIIKRVENYILIKIVFPMYSYSWILGKPFSLKYKFMLNPDIKEIGFYVPNSSNKKNSSNFWKYFLLILLIIVLIGLFIILGIYFGKKLYGLKRKKRANEMEDEYEYFEGKINSISNE